MKKILVILSIAVALLLSHNDSCANKIMASDLTWTCVGQDSFLIKLSVYTDCNGDPLMSTPIILSNKLTGIEITRLTIAVGGAVDITPVCNNSCTRCSDPVCSFPYGIHRYTMTGIVNISNAGCCEVKISWQQCCRNASITNGAAGANFFSEATLNRCISPCDNSPTFTNAPIAILCTGQDFTFCQGTQDIDVNSTGGLADSLNFEWAEPLKSEDSAIAFNGTYAYNKPIYLWGFPNANLPFPRGIHLDPQSGCIQFRPIKAEVSVMVNKVHEYRNGVKIGEIRREIQIIVITCPNNNPPVVTTPGGIRSKSVCAGDTVSFDFLTTDPNVNDTVSISWNNAIPGAKWSYIYAKHPTGTLTWIPSDAHASSLPYTFTVTAKDNACPVRATFTQSYQIAVKPKPRANIIVIDSGGGEFCFIAQRIEGSYPVYMWEGENFTFVPNTGYIVRHKFSPGIYPYTMTMVANGCTNTYFDTVVYDTTLHILSPQKTAFNFNIYPNPANGYVIIDYNGLHKWEGRLLIFDPMTKLLLNRILRFDQGNSSVTIPLNGYLPGIYLMKLENNTGSFYQKLMVR
jgi:hypothetical protein